MVTIAKTHPLHPKMIANFAEIKVAMYVCLCQGITDTHIKEAIYGGATTLRQIRQELGVMSQCGRCGVMTKQIMDETLAQSQIAHSEPLFYALG